MEVRRAERRPTAIRTTLVVDVAPYAVLAVDGCQVCEAWILAGAAVSRV